LSAAVAGYFGWTYSGPFLWFSELQRGWLGTHWVIGSFVLTWIAAGLPLFGIAALIERKLPPDNGFSDHFEVWFDFISGGWHGKAMLGGLAITGVSAWFVWTEGSAGPLTTVSLSHLEAGKPPPSRHVDLVDATPLPEEAILYQGKNYDTLYTPLQTLAGQIPVVFARSNPEKPLTFPLRGQLDEDGLPGVVRVRYEQAGRVGPHHYTLYVGRDPSKEARFGLWGLGVGVLLMGGGFAWGQRKWRALLAGVENVDGDSQVA